MSILRYKDGDTWKEIVTVKGDQGEPGLPGAPGDDGYSPTAAVTKEGRTATITVTDKDGTTTATVSDGEKGDKGDAPTAAEVEAAVRPITAKAISDMSADYEAAKDRWQSEVDALVGRALAYDSESGEYVNIEEYFTARRDARIFTVKIPKYSTSTSPACVKMDDNAGLVVEASTAAKAGRDDYRQFNAFSCPRVNGWVDDDGYPHVVAIEGDSRFDRRGIEAGGRFCDTWVMTPNLWWRWTDADDCSYLSICDSPSAGFDVQPHGLLPNGKRRPFMLYAAYAGGIRDGKLVSAYGTPLWNYFTGCGYPTSYSHNSSIGLAHERGAGYAGKTQADDWYCKVMMLLKYATKSSQTAYYGCASYSVQKPCAAAATGDYVLLSASDAALFQVGSTVCVGTATGSPDRYAANAHDVVKLAQVVSKETMGANVAMHLDAGEFSSSVGNTVSTMPYHAGYTDSVMGTDGYVSNNSGREPFKVQNIEQMIGAYEILSDTILVGSPEQEWWVCDDSALYHSGSKTADYRLVGSYAGDAASWNYVMDVANADCVLMPSGDQNSSGLGTGDGYYLPAAGSGSFELLGLGTLGTGSGAGLFCVGGGDGLGGAYWTIAGRLSAIGRSGVNAA